MDNAQIKDDCQQLDTENLFQYFKDVFGPLKDFVHAKDYLAKLKMLRDYYRTNEDRILARPDKYFASYPIDWMTLFTPIEQLAWNSIRCKRGVILYPQYPVLNYFVDFGNPAKKVALELDGKAFHNTEKDRVRDKELRASGWKVYRITGREMYRNDYMDFFDCSNGQLDEDETFSEIENWITTTGDGVIEAIANFHFRDGEEYETEYLHSLCAASLKAHQLK